MNKSLTVLHFVRDNDLREISVSAVGAFSSDSNHISGVRFEAGQLHDPVRPDLHAQPLVHVLNRKHVVVDAISGNSGNGWGIPGDFHGGGGRPAELDVGRGRQPICVNKWRLEGVEAMEKLLRVWINIWIQLQP